MERYDEPNEFGFAGDPTAPEPEPPRRRDEEHEAAERAAVPDSDLTVEFVDALDESGRRRLTELRRQQSESRPEATGG